MHRSLQNQLLAWLAALSVLGAALRPTFDTVLFAIAFVLGTMMMFVRERLEPLEPLDREQHRTIDTAPHLLGRLLGASIAWGFVAARHFQGSVTSISGSRTGAWARSVAGLVPARLTTQVLIAAAVVPTGILLLEGARLLVLRRAKAGAARDES